MLCIFEGKSIKVKTYKFKFLFITCLHIVSFMRSASIMRTCLLFWYKQEQQKKACFSQVTYIKGERGTVRPEIEITNCLCKVGSGEWWGMGGKPLVAIGTYIIARAYVFFYFPLIGIKQYNTKKVWSSIARGFARRRRSPLQWY